jgi:hypothetical protein
MVIQNKEHEDADQEKREEADVAAAVAKCKVLNDYFDRRTAAWDYYLASREGLSALAAGSASQMPLDFRDKPMDVALARLTVLVCLRRPHRRDYGNRETL